LEKKIVSPLLGLIGAGLFCLAFFAVQLGVGHNTQWGLGRQIVAIVGLGLLLISILSIVWPFFQRGLIRLNQLFQHLIEIIFGLPWVYNIFQAFKTRLIVIKESFNRFFLVRWYNTRVKQGIACILNSRFMRMFTSSQERIASTVTFFVAIWVITIYVWFVSIGHWTSWPKTTTYYSQLADAFLQGQTNLLVKPDPALFEIVDPYDFNNRQKFSTPWDVSYFNGRFFLYWGAAPAVLLVALHPFFHQEIGDQILVFVFLSGTYIFACLLILQMRSRLFPGISWAFVLPGILLVGLANPLPWLLNRPSIYEAAIASGQFFLITGLYFGFLSVRESQPKMGYLVLASLCWIFAIGSRINLAPASIFLLFMTAWRIYVLEQTKIHRTLSMIAVAFPFSAGLGVIGWYNQVRFGSWFESGHRYQLTGMNLHAIYDQVISISNIPINIHNYLLNPFRTLNVFPFIKPIWGGHFIFFSVTPPENYYSEQISGLLPSLPYVILAVIPILLIISRRKQVMRVANRHSSDKPRITARWSLEWTTISLMGASLLAFSPILLFIVATMRYLADSVPLFILSSTLGFWQGIKVLEDKPSVKRYFLLVVILLTTISIVISCLLAVSGYDSRFEKLNPVLFDQLTRLLKF
jgi:hypothetical protein